MAVILKETKSTGKDPYAYYTVNASASDRTVDTVKVSGTIDSRLSSSNASLGSGGTMGLIAYLKLNDKEYSVELKKTTEKWSGTTTHTKSFSFTIEDLESSQSQLSDIKFRVSRTGTAADNYTKGAAMSSKSCNNLQIGIGHTNPSDVSLTITEKNQKLIDAGIANDTYVNNLSIKEYNIAATLHDGATATDYNLYNGIVPSFNKSTPITIDYSTKELVTWQETGKVPMRAQVLDNFGGNGYSSSAYEPTLYDYIPYMKINLNETQSTAKRNGQTSGRVKLNVSGTFYNGTIGNIVQDKPVIKYKYWMVDDDEPATFDNTIPNDNIIVSENNFSVSGFEIGSIDETASNYFNPEKAYRVKVYVEDNFTNYPSNEKPIPVGEYTWAEYKDRVDFKRITRKGNDIIAPRVGDIVITSTNVNPATDYGGTWELIDKEFKSQYKYFKVSNATYATQNHASDGDFRVFYDSHTLHVDGTLKVNTALSDTAVDIATLKFPTLGLSLESAYFFMGWSDGGNALAMLQMTSAGVIQCVDVVGKSSSATIASGQTVYFEFSINAKYANMKDEECNKFYWKKTA